MTATSTSYPKHVYAQAPIGQVVTVYNLAQEQAVTTGTAKFTRIESAQGPTYTVILPEDK